MLSSLMLMLLMLWTGTAQAQTSPEEDGRDVTNPVWQRDWPDPTIWRGDDGRYHCLATNPRRSIVSDDLFHWEMSKVSPIDVGSWGTMQAVAERFWAPDVATVAGKRNLYLTLYNSAEDSKIGVLQEFAPGQFSYVGIITSSTETGIHDTIDPEVVTEPLPVIETAEQITEGAPETKSAAAETPTPAAPSALNLSKSLKRSSSPCFITLIPLLTNSYWHVLWALLSES